MTRTEAIRQLHSEGYRKVPHSAGATGAFAFDTYYNRYSNMLVDLALYPDGRAEIIDQRSRLS